MEYTSGIERRVTHTAKLTFEVTEKTVEVTDGQVKIIESPWVHIDIDVFHDSHKVECHTFNSHFEALNHAINMVEDLGLVSVIYMTTGGIRVLIDAKWLPETYKAKRVFEAFKADEQYVKLCQDLGIYPIRISKKPGRAEVSVAFKMYSSGLPEASPEFIKFIDLHDRLISLEK